MNTDLTLITNEKDKNLPERFKVLEIDGIAKRTLLS